MFLCAPILLSSKYGVLVGLIVSFALVGRILGEERMLLEELEGFLVTLISILCFKDLNSPLAEDQERSRLKEKVIFVAVIVMFVAGLSIYLQALQ